MTIERDNFNELLAEFDRKMAQFFAKAKRGQTLLSEIREEIKARGKAREISQTKTPLESFDNS